jgi:hypothetical protein
MLIFLTAAIVLYLFFTGYASFPRYEAYLIGNSVIVLGTLLARYGGEVLNGKARLIRWLAAFVGLILLFPLVMRSRIAFDEIGQGCVNIYEQQYQMARFLHDHYDHAQVALGDIGAVSYMTEGRKLDLVGLANIDVARSKKNYYYTPDFLDWLSKRDKVKIAIVYDYFNSPLLLQRWNKIATWQILNNVTCGDKIVSFYAVDPAEKPDLLKNLQDFQRHLPTDVRVQYY